MVNGVQTQTTVTDATGRFTFSPDEYSQNDILTLYLDTDGGAPGVTVTVAGADDITDLDVYQNRLITRHDNAGSLTNTQLNTADDSGDTDISAIYSVDGSNNLTMQSGKELFVWAGDTFAPGERDHRPAGHSRHLHPRCRNPDRQRRRTPIARARSAEAAERSMSMGTSPSPAARSHAPSGTLAVSQNFTQTGSPTWDANGGTVSFDGSVAGNFSVNAPDVTFNVVAINRSFSSFSNRTLTIASGTTIPLGDSPTLNLNNTAFGTYYANLINNGTITTTSSGTWTANVDGTFTNNGTVTADSITAWTMNGNFTNNGAVSMANASTVDVNNYNDSDGTFINNAGSSFSTAASPTWTITGSLIADAASIFPNGASVTFDGSVAGNYSVDAPGVTFNVVAINRSVVGSGSYTFTIASGTTIPLGGAPTLTLLNTADRDLLREPHQQRDHHHDLLGNVDRQRRRHVYEQRDGDRRQHHGVDHERQLHEQQHREHGQCVDDRCEQLR